MWSQTLLAQIEHDVAEWLQHDQNLKTWTVEHGPTGGFGWSVATCRWWWCLLVYCYPRRTKEAFLTQWLSWTRHKLGRITRMPREGAASLVQKLAACLWTSSKAVQNNWSPVFSEERRRIVGDVNEICVRVDEDHVWVSEFNMVSAGGSRRQPVWKKNSGETEVWETSCALQISTEQPFKRDGPRENVF